MMDQNPESPQILIRKALAAVRQGDKIRARQYASLAAKIAPNLEEPWLVLAALASPDASIAYLQKALEINPSSEKAQEGMKWALARKKEMPVEPPPEPGDTAPIGKPPASATPSQVDLEIQTLSDNSISDTAPIQVRKYKPSQKRPRWFLFSILVSVFFLLGITGVGWTYFSWFYDSQPYSAAKPEDILIKPSLTPTETSTPSPTFTFIPTPTETPTPLPTFTPTSTSTPIPPTSTPIPTRTPTKPAAVQPTKKSVSTPSGGTSGTGSKEGRWIDVDLSKQRLYAYEGSTLLRTFVVSTGTWQHPTVKGQYRIYVKYRYASMSGPGYYLPNVPYVMYFYQGYGIHGTYWHNNFGTPMSHGCVNLRTEDAGWLFNWASVGTLVNIH